MKTLSYALMLVASAAFVLVGCSDTPQSPVASTTALTSTNGNTGPSLMKPGGGSGAVIERFGTNYLIWWFLDENGMLVTIGVNNAADYCNYISAAKDVFSWKLVYLPYADPDLMGRIVAQMKGSDLTALVFQVVPDPLKTHLRDYCPLVPLMVGTAKFIYHDNDWNGVGNLTNTFGANANGTVTGPDGKVYKLSVSYHGSWDLVDPASFVENVKIQIK